VRCSNGDAECGSACNAPRSPATALLLPHFEIHCPSDGDPDRRTPTGSAQAWLCKCCASAVQETSRQVLVSATEFCFEEQIQMRYILKGKINFEGD
jgi:hypothetical protein